MGEDRSRAGAKARWEAAILAAATTDCHRCVVPIGQKQMLAEEAIARVIRSRPRPPARAGYVIGPSSDAVRDA